MHWLGEEDTRTTPLHYYLMQIACEIRCIAEGLFSKKPKGHNIKEFEIKFETKQPEQQIKQMDTRTMEERAAEAKNVWKARLGIG